MTSSLSGTRSNQLSYKPRGVGGGSRIRTGDVLLAKQALYQLSHAPPGGGRARRPCRKGGGTRGGEPGRPARLNFGTSRSLLLRKEVIQPLVPQRLPCYDFIPITTHTLGRRSAGLRVQTAFMM